MTTARFSSTTLSISHKTLAGMCRLQGQCTRPAGEKRTLRCHNTVLAVPFNQSVPLHKAGCAVESVIVQELCESRGGRPGLSVRTSLLVSVDVKLY